MYAIKLKRTGGLVRNSCEKIYLYNTYQEAERMAKVCYFSGLYEIVKVRG